MILRRLPYFYEKKFARACTYKKNVVSLRAFCN